MNTLQKVNNEIDNDSEAKTDLLQLVHDDNAAVAELFFQFTQAEEDEEKQDIFDQISLGLTVHTELVEELLYPLVIETAEEDDEEEAEKLVAEAEAGNHVASLILNELKRTEPDDEYFEAKMSILCELIKKQVKREEKEMFDKLRAADIDFEDIGIEAAERKAELLEDAASSKSRSKSKLKSKVPAKTGAKKGASKPALKAGNTTKKTTPSKGKKTASKPAAKASKPAKKATTSKAGTGTKKAGSARPAARAKSSAKSTAKKRSR